MGPKARLKRDATPIAATAGEFILIAFKNAKI